MTDDIISENWRTPGLPIGNYYASLGNKYAYFYAAHCVNENPGSKQQIKDTIGPLKNEIGEFSSDTKFMADTLNKFFASSFTREDTSNVPQTDDIFLGSEDDKLGLIHISKAVVIKHLKKLSPNKSPGPDQIGSSFLLEVHEVIAEPLCYIFNKSLCDGEVPRDWKVANVTPIFKKGNKSDPGNFRPISLTSQICKVLESIIKEKIVNHLDTYSLIHESQHGFTKGKSCLTILLSFLEDITKSVDDGKPVDVIYLDFSKAFDKVPHQRLILKNLNLTALSIKFLTGLKIGYVEGSRRL